MTEEEHNTIQASLESIADLLPKEMSPSGMSYMFFMLARAYELDVETYTAVTATAGANLLMEKYRKELN